MLTNIKRVLLECVQCVNQFNHNAWDNKLSGCKTCKEISSLVSGECLVSFDKLMGGGRHEDGSLDGRSYSIFPVPCGGLVLVKSFNIVAIREASRYNLQAKRQAHEAWI